MSAKRYDLSWADFQPIRLRSVRQRIVEQHPSTATKLRAASESQLQQLKDRITAAVGDESALRSLARELKASQLRGLAIQIGPWEELRDAVATILRERSRRSLLPHLWSTWQGYPGVAQIHALLQELANEYGWTGVAEGYEGAVDRWLGATYPPAELQRWLDEQGLSYSDMSELADFPFSPDTPLDRSIRTAVMTNGTESQLRTEGPERLTSWFSELESEYRMQFGENYLETIDVNRWEPPVLELLRETYGPPPAGREAFWRRVSDKLRSAFNRWFIERNLEEALGSDTDRHRYWHQWSGELVDVELGTAGRVEYAILDFGTFGVIEFFEKGNAAYFYPSVRLEEVRGGKARHPSDLKDRYSPRFSRGDNRLIHGGNWQPKADRQLRTWKRGTS